MHNEGVLTKKEKFIFTLVRTGKGFGMNFLADTFGMCFTRPRFYNLHYLESFLVIRMVIFKCHGLLGMKDYI